MSAQLSEQEHQLSHKLIYLYPLFVSLFFLAATPIAILYTKEWNFFENLLQILTSPSKLVTDYFALGGLAPTLFNAGICGTACTLIVILSRARANSTTFAAYILVIQM